MSDNPVICLVYTEPAAQSLSEPELLYQGHVMAEVQRWRFGPNVKSGRLKSLFYKI